MHCDLLGPSPPDVQWMPEEDQLEATAIQRNFSLLTIAVYRNTDCEACETQACEKFDGIRDGRVLRNHDNK